MKKLIMLLLAQVCWDSSVFAQCTCHSAGPMFVKSDSVTWRMPVEFTDTIHEPILVSTRVPGFVRTEMALAVRINGICVKHLDCHGHELKYPVYVWDCDNRKKKEGEMSRRDYLKHLGFATAQAMANANKTQIMALPQETQQAIANRAAAYADQAHANDGDDIHIGYLDGATEWAEKAQGLVDALEMARREIVALYKTKGYSESFVTRTIDEAIAKYKEVG